jgi:hypothetical protein
LDCVYPSYAIHLAMCTYYKVVKIPRRHFTGDHYAALNS